MIKLTKEDLIFKKAAQYPRPDKLILAAIALETADDARTKYGQVKPYNQRSVIGLLMSVLGWNGSSESRAKQKEYENWWHDHIKKSEFKQQLIKMISGYVFECIMVLDREQKKSYREIAQWLREMAK